eukprot:snap_masked-scaffold_9-processed-gene-2.22-mRNA-1 protein AED:0.03 eAED:0.03 QI:0/-1/0/1/-1/1/1/0/172
MKMFLRRVSSLSHVDNASNLPKMVDVSHKNSTLRKARALTQVILPKNLLTQENLVNGQIHSKKGPIFSTAIIAATMAVKKTSELLPFCHPLNIQSCKVEIDFDEFNTDCIRIECEVGMKGETGVEMEALTGASVAALCVYDMLKALSHDIIIQETKLLWKSGGKSDYGNKVN